MHEMSIATNILEIAEQSMNGYDHLVSVSVQIGELAGVEIDALKFCFNAIKRTKEYDGLDLHVEIIEGRGRCKKCKSEAPMHELYAMCPECQTHTLRPEQGRELKVTSIEVE